ncbi:MAG: hypothetical protein CL535_21400 [Ahrensia sp.]|nr:hypothetical protein [Ahrensia sp.]
MLRDIGVTQANAMRDIRVSFPWHLSFPWRGYRRRRTPGAEPAAASAVKLSPCAGRPRSAHVIALRLVMRSEEFANRRQPARESPD